MPITTTVRPVIRIHSLRSRPVSPLAQLWASRELIISLARRHVRVRYNHAAIGIGWAVLQPLFTVLALAIFQRVVGSRPGPGIPYPLLAMSGMVPWTFLLHAITLASSSLLSFYGVIQKVYFPRLTLPLAAVAAGTVDFGVALPLIPLAMLYFGVRPTRTVFLLPVFAGLLIVFAAALGIWLAMLNTLYRDTSNALPFVTQLWFFLSPIAYSADLVPARWATLAGLNPMLGILEGFRWALFGQSSAHLPQWLLLSSATTAILLVSGVMFFLHHEDSLTDNL